MINTTNRTKNRLSIYKNLLNKFSKQTFLIVIVAIHCIVACSSPIKSGDQKSNMFTDDYGRTVEVPHSIEKIVSLSPAITEIIYTLHCEELLVGRTEFCKYPPECEEITNIGGISNLNIEAVVALSPDLVISGSMVTKKNITQLENMGIPVVCIKEKTTFDGLYQTISQLGEILNCKETADSINHTIQTQIHPLPLDTTEANRPTMYYVVGYGNTGNFTAGGNSFINDIINLSGGTNIASKISGWSFSTEALLDINPDYIIIRKEDADNFCKTHPYSQLSAVKNNRIITIESNIIDLQIPRNIEAINIIRKYVTENPIK